MAKAAWPDAQVLACRATQIISLGLTPPAVAAGCQGLLPGTAPGLRDLRRPWRALTATSRRNTSGPQRWSVPPHSASPASGSPGQKQLAHLSTPLVASFPDLQSALAAVWPLLPENTTRTARRRLGARRVRGLEQMEAEALSSSAIRRTQKNKPGLEQSTRRRTTACRMRRQHGRRSMQTSPADDQHPRQLVVS